MKRLGFGMFVVHFACILYCCPSAWAQSRTPAITKWEYRIETGCRWLQQERLDQLGREGWELVTTSGYDTDNRCLDFVFKRPLSRNAAILSPAKLAPSATLAPACIMTLDQSPTIHGLRLGMSATEVATLLPDFKTRIEDILKHHRPARHSLTMANFSFQIPHPNYAESEQQKALAKQFAPATSVSISFFLGKVAGLHIEYQVSSDLPQWNAQNWIQKLAESYGLPSFESWQKPKGAEGYALTCAGFEVRIPNHYSPLAFTLSDTQAVASAKQWLADEDIRLRREFKP